MEQNFSNNHATPISSIRAFCIQCNGYERKGVRECETVKCPLYPYKMNHRPSASSHLINLEQAIKLSKR